MQTPHRPAESGVIGSLQQAPFRFQFYQAVKVLIIRMQRNGIAYDRALSECIRFQNSLSLAFPASEIAAVQMAHGADDLPSQVVPLHDLHEQAGAVRMAPAFMGLLGMMGTLPAHYTEQILIHQQRERDDAPRAFLDIFSDRMVTLLYQAWAKYRIEHSIETQGRDDFLPRLLALCGARPSATDSPDAGDHVIGFYAGLLRQRPVSAVAMRCVLRDYLRVPLEIDQFVGAWDDIESARQCQLGGPNAVLGYSGALGFRKWRHDVRLRVRIGPLSRAADFERFLPGTTGVRALEKVLALMDVPGMQLEALVTLVEADLRTATLVGGSGRATELGWGGVLGKVRQNVSHCDVRFLLRPALAMA